MQSESVGTGPETAQPVRVMTRNLYLGASLAPLAGAETVQQFMQIAAERFQMVQETNFPARAVVLAREIKEADPILVGLQEVTLWRRGEPGVLDGPITPATTVVYDYRQLLLEALTAAGLHYSVLVAQTTGDTEVPTALGYDIRFTQRVVILAKDRLPPDEFAVSDTAGGIFSASSATPSPLGRFVSKRGWVWADVTVNRRAFRLINTHLDSFDTAVRQAQAQELLAGPARTSQPVILVGDLNSAPNEPAPSAYSILTGAGFSDTWVQANGSDAGLTCCNVENLLNPSPAFSLRIDHVLTRPQVTVVGSKRVGIDPDNRTPDCRWPSDHAGIIAALAP